MKSEISGLIDKKMEEYILDFAEKESRKNNIIMVILNEGLKGKRR